MMTMCKRFTSVLALGAACFASACTRPAPDATPEGAVRQWIERMEATNEDPRAIRSAYALLGPAARANLEERAKRATQVEGHRVEPWDMIAEGRFGLKFRPKTMVSRVNGDAASVEVTGDEPLTEHALVHCVREPSDGASGESDRRRALVWHVEPDLPPVPSLPQREADPAPPKPGN
jgi:hypothetical protein